MQLGPDETTTTVFIDQYDLDAGELSDKWWKVTKKLPR
jgi:hypothetical protein